MIDGKVQYTFGETKSNKPLIDDTAFDELRTLGTKEEKVSKAKGLAEASGYAKGQLVEVTDELALADLLKGLSKTEKETILSARKIQLDNWAQFNRSMKLWGGLKANEDAVEGDYYIESRRKMPFYRSRPDEDVISGKLPEERTPPDKEKRRKRYLELKARVNK